MHESSGQATSVAVNPSWANKFYVAIFVLYAIGLLASVPYHRAKGATGETSLWDLQDTRLLIAWISAHAWSAFLKGIRFLPLGFMAPPAIAAIQPAGGRARVLILQVITFLVPCAYSVAVQAFETGWDQAIEAPVVCLFPAVSCLLGTWIGMAWLRGRRAILWLGARVAIVLCLMVGGFAIFLWFVVDDAPLNLETVSVTSEDKRRLVSLIRSKDPRDLDPDQHETLELTEHDLNVLLSWGMSIGSKLRTAQVDLGQGSAALYFSFELPGGRDSRYLNLTASFEPRFKAGRLTFRKARFRLGRINVPRWLSNMLAQSVAYHLNRDRHLKTLMASIDRIDLQEEQAAVAYGAVDLPSGYFAEVLDRLRPAGNIRGPAREYVRYLASVAESLPSGDACFGACMVQTFRLARERSRKGDPVLENRAAIFALAALMGHYRVQTFIGPLLDQPLSPAARAAFGEVTVLGRWDWVRHFYVSAALELISNEFTSDAVGLLKEELDAGRGGSGFSFGDLLADRAGTTFATVATRSATSARQLQDRIADGFRIADFFPEAADLPEGMSDAVLTEKYGGVGGEHYQQVVDEIERRIAACAAYKP